MKKVYFLVAVLFTCLISGQNKENPLVILDSKNIGFMNEAQPILEPINPNDISTMSVYKGDASKKYGSENGVIIITTKKYILDTFYKNNIENSSLKKEIPTTEILAKIGVFGSKADSKNLPYDELIKYVDTNTVNDTVLKIASITFIKPLDAQKINPDWKFGALEIKPSVTE
ncbi:TonB-dependent receptor [Flavobacterium sp. FlaQc-57]|uniref:TonB-dependent receptor n=1 Tax=Flavobacterium sp. FlaQc-57 TaxID=3374186 RepID=UPI0037584540